MGLGHLCQQFLFAAHATSCHGSLPITVAMIAPGAGGVNWPGSLREIGVAFTPGRGAEIELCYNDGKGYPARAQRAGVD